jgi:serine/threonine-protein kinase
MARPSQPTEGSPGESWARLGLPAQLGRYTLLRELGSGGMASVYLAKVHLAEGVERLVALKTIHDELSGQPTFVDMFLDEARIASLISHPNVCTVHDFGQAGDTYYLAMEYLVGEPLSEVVRMIWENRHDDDVLRATPYVAARIMADACEGLHAAHETAAANGQRLEVVHRDVSPQNLFVTYDGAVKVVDFGCAKAVQRISETSAGIFKGKIAYAAPEQLKIEKLDARTDVWALGACLWEALTLERLFKRDTPMQSAKAILSEHIPRADEVSPDVPSVLADITERALTRNPLGRFQTARDMGRALRLFIAGSGASFESAEVADWMSYLFADRRARLLRMVEEAESTLASHVEPSGSFRERGHGFDHRLDEEATRHRAMPRSTPRYEPDEPSDEVSDDAPTPIATPLDPYSPEPYELDSGDIHAEADPDLHGDLHEAIPLLREAHDPASFPDAQSGRQPTLSLYLDPEDRPERPREGGGWVWWLLLAVVVLGAAGSVAWFLHS